MNRSNVSTVVLVAASLAAVGGIAFAQQDKYTLKVQDGLALSEFEGYDTWEDVSVSETKGSVKAILGNATMITAYKEGIPNNGKPFPEGVKIVKSNGSKRGIRYLPTLWRYQIP